MTFYVLNLLFLKYISKLYKNINIMNTQIFHDIKYDLKGHRRSIKALLAKFFLAH